jgi:hypothetical protein
VSGVGDGRERTEGDVTALIMPASPPDRTTERGNKGEGWGEKEFRGEPISTG